MNYKIASIAGDGIGPEIVREARKVLDKIGQKYGHTFEYEELLMGGCSIDVYGESLTDETLEKAKACDSILLGAVRRKCRSVKLVSDRTKPTPGSRIIKMIVKD